MTAKDRPVERLQHALLTALYVHRHQRLGQLLFNALMDGKEELINEEFHSVLFNVSDQDLIQALERYSTAHAQSALAVPGGQPTGLAV